MTHDRIIAHFNGQSCDLNEVKVSPLDRGFVFGDGVYEVLRVYNGKAFLLEEHMARLERSLSTARLPPLYNARSLIIKNIADNKIEEGMVYLQLTRGAAPRLHSFKELDIKPTVLIYSKHFIDDPAETSAKHGIRAITLPDLRWGCCNIKSLNLLANCMAQTTAQERGAEEALLLRDGSTLSEGSTSNVFVVKDGVVKTPPLSGHILAGTRRNFVLQAMKKDGIAVEECVLYQNDLQNADEIFITSTIKEAVGVVELDGKKVGRGLVGFFSRRARTLIHESLAND